MQLFRSRIHRFTTNDTSWREGRAFLFWKFGPYDPRERERKHRIGLHVEWNLASRMRWPLGLKIDLGGEHRGIAAAFHVWRVYLYGAIENVLPRRLTRWLWQKFHISEEIRVVAIDLGSTVRWQLWLDGMQGTKPGTYDRAPAWRDFHLDLVDLVLGRPVFEERVIREGIDVVVPLPERSYPAKAKLTTATWKRPRWPFTTTRDSVWLDVGAPGLPFAGKGENSWDLGDDGFYGIGSEGHSIPKAIGHAVTATLERRKQYGDPSWLRKAGTR